MTQDIKRQGRKVLQAALQVSYKHTNEIIAFTYRHHVATAGHVGGVGHTDAVLPNISEITFILAACTLMLLQLF